MHVVPCLESMWLSDALLTQAANIIIARAFFSVVLLVLVDANYKFLWTDMGGYGEMSDSQIFNESELKQCLC